MASPGKKAYPLRVDPALWAAIERLAAQELRSANAQVEFLLREGLARRGRLPVAATELNDSSTVSTTSSADYPPSEG